jgi:hypothetical protein
MPAKCDIHPFIIQSENARHIARRVRLHNAYANLQYFSIFYDFGFIAGIYSSVKMWVAYTNI